MASDNSDGHRGRPRQSIPLQNLGSYSDGNGNDYWRNESLERRQPSRDVSPTDAQMVANLPGMSWDPDYREPADHGLSGGGGFDAVSLQSALPFEIQRPPSGASRFGTTDPFDNGSLYNEESPNGYYNESDRMPLTAGASAMPGTLKINTQEAPPRTSFQTVSDIGGSPTRGRQRSLGEDLEPARLSAGRHQQYGNSLTPTEYRSSHISSGSGAFLRAGSIVRAMSQRVVNISGEGEISPRPSSRSPSRSPRASFNESARNTLQPEGMFADTSYHSQMPPSPSEKAGSQPFVFSQEQGMDLPRGPAPNPLRGKSLGIFGPDNWLRRWLCDLLVKPYTEVVVLLLIITQTILLAVEAWPDVFTHGNGRPKGFGAKPMDWAMLGLFIFFTLELIARIIVSGFVLNASEYSTIDRKKGVRVALANQYKAVFQPDRHKSVRIASQIRPEPQALVRSFTTFMGGQSEMPATVKDQQRFQLARRAFLRHSFNRLDFVAVLSFWIDLLLQVTHLASEHHLYVFKMLSCLRILRLLAITHGTSVILRSLKKATPLLVRVAFLICFFWLLFAIIGIQSFKSSLKRQCVWLDPLDPDSLSASYTNDYEFCGGYLNNDTGKKMPWMRFGDTDSLNDLQNGTSEGKGFLCPRGSICLEQQNPENGTVNFDNIFNSLELVFVIMSANTFSDLMYYTMGSDYTAAALFFGAGIMILTLWMTNLLIAVITSSFQVIREESKSSAFTDDHEPLMHRSREERLLKASSLERLYDRSRAFWILVIVFGLISQACRSATMSDFRKTYIDAAEIIVTALLDLEIAMRIVMNWREFHRRRRNLFDLALAVITTIILIPPIKNSEAYSWLSIFQILRAYRIVLAVPVTRTLILLVLGNAAGIANLMLFVFLMTFLMAIFAVQLFRGELPVYIDGDLNRISFYTMYNAFLGMYQVLTSENWTDILYTVTSYTKSRNLSWIGALFLIGWFILAFFILVNMFIAVIQENFDVSEDEKRLEQVKSFLQKKGLDHAKSNLSLSTIFGFGKSRQRKDPLDYGPAMMEMLLKDAVVREFLDDQMDPMQDGNLAAALPPRTTTLLGNQMKESRVAALWLAFLQRINKSGQNPFYTNLRFDGPNDTLDPRQMARQAVSATAARRQAQREYLAKYPSYNTSLWIFEPKNKIRRLCQRLVGPARGLERFDGVEPNKYAWYIFSVFTYCCIVAMVILACVVTPLYQKQYVATHSVDITNWYIWTDLAFALIFTVETMIKIIADGFFWSPNAYVRSSWGILDTVVLITLWIDVVTLLINDGAISRAVGAFKALRALRLLNVSDSARDTFHSLIIVGWWKILGAAFVSISLLIPFAIYGLNLFNGLLVACNDTDDITKLDQCFGEFNSYPYSDDWAFLAPRVAANPYFSFDDFGSSLFTLFQIVSQEGWIDVSFAVQSITGLGQQPQDLASEANALFFVAFNLLGTVFVLTLFISVFMRNYTEQTGVAFLTAEQRSWVELRKMLRQVSPSKSSYRANEKSWKRWCHKRAIEKRGRWYRSITLVLVLHLILLVIEFDDEPVIWTRTREAIFLVFTLFYIANIVIRIVGLGWSRFRKSSWDLYSVVAVAGAFVATLALVIVGPDHETYEQFHKFFLVAIVLLIIPRNDALDQLFKTAAASLTVIGNLLATWIVMFLVFAIAMTQSFSLTRFGPGESSDINFRDVPNALILLFRMSLGEGWNEVMEEFAGIEPPLCVDDSDFFKSDCGSKAWARFLFVAWNLLSMYIFVNLFVSLIYESFSYVYQRSSGVASVDRDEIRRFKEAWRSVDPNGTGFITKDAFPRLLGELSGVFQMKVYDSEDSVGAILEDVRGDMRAARHTSFITTNDSSDIDLAKLNERIAQIDVVKVREQRRRFNLFYGEVMVSADPDKGISFTNVLMILAHYKIISDSKSLKLDEFLRRRARLQRVDEEVRRKTVQGFFDTLYWARKFRKHMDRKRSSRMTAVPQLDIPDIFVEEEGGDNKQASSQGPSGYSAGGMSDGMALGEASPFADTASYQHPLSFPPSSAATWAPSGGYGGGVQGGGFSFELYEPEPASAPPLQTNTQAFTQAAQGQPRPESLGEDDAGHRRGSSSVAPVSPSQARDMLDDSVWVESIRRSATTRRSDGSNHRY